MPSLSRYSKTKEVGAYRGKREKGRISRCIYSKKKKEQGGQLCQSAAQAMKRKKEEKEVFFLTVREAD